MKKIKVIISKDNSHAVSDWNALEWYQNLKDGDTAYVATPTMFNEIRIGVSRSEIAPFSFEFEGQELSVGEHGELVEGWPVGFFDHQGIQVKMLMNMNASREGVTQAQKELKERHKNRKNK